MKRVSRKKSSRGLFLFAAVVSISAWGMMSQAPRSVWNVWEASTDRDADKNETRSGHRRPEPLGIDRVRAPSPGAPSQGVAITETGESETDPPGVDWKAEWEAAASRMDAIENCIRTQSCSYSQETPMSFDRSAFSDLEIEIRRIVRLSDGWVRTNGKVPDIALDRARRYLLAPDDGVKDAALDLLSRVPPSASNMRAVLEGLKTSLSSRVYRKGLGELSRYVNREERSEVQRFLLQELRTGGQLGSWEVARGVLPFLRDENVGAFRSLMQNLPRRSKAYTYLKMNLDEFKRMQRGG